VELLIEVVSWIFLISGSFFVLVGGFGVLRMPDVYTRSHAAGVTDTLGAGLILLGLMAQAGLTLITVKLFLILVFLLFTSPTSSFALNHTAWTSGLRPLLDNEPPIKQTNETDGKD